MSVTITEEINVDTSFSRSTHDGFVLLEIDTSLEEHEGIRISLNDGLLYSGRPVFDNSPIGVLEEIRDLITHRTSGAFGAADAPVTVDKIREMIENFLPKP